MKTLTAMIPIDPESISVVIQGPLCRNLAPNSGIIRCIESIRKHLPGAEIVVSTWNRECVDDLQDCKVITSAEPSEFYDISGNQINTNRLIRSTRVGIETATREYVLKFRADHLLTNATIASIAEYDDSVTEKDRLLRCPITVTNLFIRNPSRVPMLFHLSDIIQFGLRDDMLKIWDQDLLAEENHFIQGKISRNPFGNFIGYSNLRVVPEQAIIIRWLRSCGFEITIDHVCHVTRKMLILWEGILANNFNVIDWQDSGIHFPVRFLNTGYSLKTVYS
ncbi:WavE lipopolysaccharide synthesis family protein, partial [Aquitalea sp. ASV11]|uniref:WavE lipopolysaccharide synthesis family protein n=1 Tax=Aquitalea sp. ASV11 TaxID=2795103 RepID=UPI0018EC43AD